MVGGSETTVDSTTVELVELTNTNVLTEVDVTGNRGSSLVEPLGRVLGRELVTGTGLHELDVTGDLESTLTSKEGSVSINELLSRDISVKAKLVTGSNK